MLANDARRPVRHAAYGGAVTVPYLDELEHPGAVVGIAATVLGATWVLAVQRPVTDWELRLGGWINEAPGGVAVALYPVMQLGTLVAPLAVGTAIGVTRKDRLLGAAVATTGIVTWFGAKGVKRLVERGRPLAYLPDTHVREGDGSGLGFVSGHAAVAAATALMAIVVLPRSWRPVLVGVAGLVGLARIVVGVHLPADVVGGWSFGVLLGVGGLGAAGLARSRSDR